MGVMGNPDNSRKGVGRDRKLLRWLQLKAKNKVKKCEDRNSTEGLCTRHAKRPIGTRTKRETKKFNNAN